jgi:hypothetical protein
MELAVATTAVGILKLMPEVIEVGKNIWGKLKPPEQLAIKKGQNGVSGKTYYSGNYAFAISIPDDNWRFWEPSPQFKASFGLILAMPTRDIPILILSNQMIKIFRPFIIVLIEDVGSFTNIKEYTDFNVSTLTPQGFTINANDIHISLNNSSSAFIATQPYAQGTMYQVYKTYIYASRAYTVVVSYVPISDESPQLFGGLQDILESFKLIK